MKERSHSNVSFVIKNSQKKATLNIHLVSVHEGKKPLKCEFCIEKFTEKERKLLYQSENCTLKFTHGLEIHVSNL